MDLGESIESGKIGVFGPHCVGKDNFVTQLYAHLIHFNYVPKMYPEMVEEAAKIGLPINRETTFETQAGILDIQKFYERGAEHLIRTGKITHAVFNRIVLDNYAYAENKDPKRARAELFESVKIWMETHPYALLFRIPLWNRNLEIVPNNFRDTDKGFQIQIEDRIENLAQELHVRHILVPAELYTQDYITQSANMAAFLQDIIKPRRPIVIPK